jgi:hypothetical protein
MMKRYARYIGRDAGGRKVYRIPVKVIFNNSAGTIDDWCNPPTAEFDVIAYSAADAANWARAQYATRPETEIVAWGPQGGETRRFIGWESAIGAEMLAPRAPINAALFQ